MSRARGRASRRASAVWRDPPWPAPAPRAPRRSAWPRPASAPPARAAWPRPWTAPRSPASVPAAGSGLRVRSPRLGGCAKPLRLPHHATNTSFLERRKTRGAREGQPGPAAGRAGGRSALTPRRVMALSRPAAINQAGGAPGGAGHGQHEARSWTVPGLRQRCNEVAK